MFGKSICAAVALAALAGATANAQAVGPFVGAHLQAGMKVCGPGALLAGEAVVNLPDERTCVVLQSNPTPPPLAVTTFSTTDLYLDSQQAPSHLVKGKKSR